MYLNTTFPGLGADFPVAPAEYFELREINRSFAEVGAYTTGEVNLTAGDRPLRVRVAFVDEHLVRALGLRPAEGRLFATGETEVSAPWSRLLPAHGRGAPPRNRHSDGARSRAVSRAGAGHGRGFSAHDHRRRHRTRSRLCTKPANCIAAIWRAADRHHDDGCRDSHYFAGGGRLMLAAGMARVTAGPECNAQRGLAIFRHHHLIPSDHAFSVSSSTRKPPD